MSVWPGNSNFEMTTFGGLTRGQLMARVPNRKNKTTEAQLANLLRREKLSGWRRQAALPGRPDFTWHQRKTIVFVDGCFWHGHECGKNIHPKSNAEAWRQKLLRNRRRDREVRITLRQQGWTVLRIWECRLAKNPGREIQRIRRALETAGHAES